MPQQGEPGGGGGGGITALDLTSSHPALGMPLLNASAFPEHKQKNGTGNVRVSALGFAVNDVAQLVPVKVPGDLDTTGNVTIQVAHILPDTPSSEYVDLRFSYGMLVAGSDWDVSLSNSDLGETELTGSTDDLVISQWTFAASGLTAGGIMLSTLTRVTAPTGEYAHDIDVIGLYISFPVS